MQERMQMSMKAPSLPQLKIATENTTTAGDTSGSIPQPPRGRGTEFVKRWREYAKIMAEGGNLDTRYLPALEMLCDAHQQIIEADNDLVAAGGRYVQSEKGTIMAHPACVRRETAKREVLKYQQELCLTPATHSKAKQTKKTVKVVESAGR
jgi:P27 family predicted phage terminase small subunit